MLKLKDNIDLRRINKKELHFKGIEILGRTIFLERKEYGKLEYKQLDTLYDLIKNDLVEKVE